MSTETKKNTWKLILQLIVSIATAIATTIGVTSCMGANVYLGHLVNRERIKKGLLEVGQTKRTARRSFAGLSPGC